MFCTSIGFSLIILYEQCFKITRKSRVIYEQGGCGKIFQRKARLQISQNSNFSRLMVKADRLKGTEKAISIGLFLYGS